MVVNGKTAKRLLLFPKNLCKANLFENFKRVLLILTVISSVVEKSRNKKGVIHKQRDFSMRSQGYLVEMTKENVTLGRNDRENKNENEFTSCFY